VSPSSLTLPALPVLLKIQDHGIPVAGQHPAMLLGNMLIPFVPPPQPAKYLDLSLETKNSQRKHVTIKIIIRVNTERITILLNCSINQTKVIAYLSYKQGFLEDFKEFQDKTSLQGKQFVIASVTIMYKLH